MRRSMSDLGTRIPSHKPDVEQRPSGRLDEEAAAAAPDQIVELDQRRTIGAVLRAHAKRMKLEFETRTSDHIGNGSCTGAVV